MNPASLVGWQIHVAGKGLGLVRSCRRVLGLASFPHAPLSLPLHLSHLQVLGIKKRLGQVREALRPLSHHSLTTHSLSPLTTLSHLSPLSLSLQATLFRVQWDSGAASLLSLKRSATKGDTPFRPIVRL